MSFSRRQAMQSMALSVSALSGCASLSNQDPIFDAHCHIIDHRFPVVANQGYIPPHFPLDQYMKETEPLGVVSGAIVSGSFHGFDQTYLKAALKALGPQWVGVTQIPNHISDQEILELTQIGVKALRFNVFRGRIDDVKDIVSLALRVHAIGGWHAEIYADASALAPHVGALSKLPQIVIDHLGMTQQGLPVLLDLVDAGAKVKATGFGRVDIDIPQALEKITLRNSKALIFGTDIPSTRAKRAFAPSDIDLIKKVLGPSLSRQVLWSNAIALYGLNKSALKA